MSTPVPPIPTARGEEAIFFAALREHELVFQACEACAAVVFPMRTVCPSCGGETLARRVSAGRGVIHSFTTQYRSPGPAFPAPHTLVLVDLDEGFRVLADLPGVDDADVRIGMPVRAVFDDVSPEATVLRFALDGATTTTEAS